MQRTARLATPVFMLKSVAIQAIAFAASIVIWPVVPSIPFIIIASSLIALIAAALIQLPTPWLIVNAALPLAAALTLAIDVPGYVYLAPLIVIGAIYSPALLNRVPYYPTPRPAYAVILAELPTDRPFEFVDIGCGFGDLILFLARHRPNGKFVGIELGPLPCLIAKLKSIIQSAPNVTVKWRNMWRFSLSQSDFVYTFLSPAAMDEIWHKAADEMPANSTFITNTFPVPSPAHEEIAVRDERASRIYIHKIKHTPKNAN
jgi:hypothetical protein